MGAQSDMEIIQMVGIQRKYLDTLMISLQECHVAWRCLRGFCRSDPSGAVKHRFLWGVVFGRVDCVCLYQTVSTIIQLTFAGVASGEECVFAEVCIGLPVDEDKNQARKPLSPAVLTTCSGSMLANSQFALIWLPAFHGSLTSNACPRT